ncbi:MAG: hypothetical protein J4203_04335 [Candidatus Diapherotrites archaeon]|uniref:Bacterial repeat domain-containing protein n=1 Tax=Candidatus Iainarchaeum sp. TaxID=3101447 RepID=A0A8T4LJM1_9ARCH|nr:hypothetical protein [Candidatus Diapherotrites archaeon]
MFAKQFLPLVCLLLFAALGSAAQLTVHLEGQGYVSSYPSGILCGAACQETYDEGTEMTLTAHPSEGMTFLNWEGCDSANGLLCIVTLNGDVEVTANFSGPTSTEFRLRVTRSGTATGKVQSTDGLIFCGSLCLYDEAKYQSGSTVTLNASPGTAFTSWQGDCSGTQATCTLSMDSDKEVEAVFGQPTLVKELPEPAKPTPSPGQPPQTQPPSTPPKPPAGPPKPGDFSLHVEVAGGLSGSPPGTVVSSDKRVNCQAPCDVGYAAGSQVPLEAVPAKGYKFSGWEGACGGPQAACTALVKGGSIFFRPVTNVRAVFVPVLANVEVSVSGPGRVTDPYRIGCPAFCAASYPLPQGSVTLTASQAADVTFEGWGGACQGTQPTCTVALSEASPMKVSASFKGPPPPPKLTVSVKGNGKDKLWMQVGGPKQAVTTVECTGECTYTYPRGTTVQFVPYPDARQQLKDLGGACLGKKDAEVACSVLLDSDKQVTASFSPRDFRKLTVVKPVLGEVDSSSVIRPSSGGDIHSWDDKIRCGNADNACSAEYDSFMKVTLQFKADDPNGVGVFLSGCDEVKPSFYGGTYCLVGLSKGDRTVETWGSLQQEQTIVREALFQVFNQRKDCHSRLNLLLLTGEPFQRVLPEYKAKRAGRTIEDVKAYLKGLPASWRTDTGIQTAFDQCNADLVQGALREVFAGESKQFPVLTNFLMDPNQRPTQRGAAIMSTLTAAPPNPPDFKDWLQKNKTLAYEQWGIKDFLDNWKQGEEARKKQDEAKRQEEANRTPSISSISPDGWQIGKQPILAGGDFVNVASVTIDGAAVRFDPRSANEIALPDIEWGVDERGRKPDKPGRVRVTLANGKYTEANLISPARAITLHAEGKEEACFGGVGKACSGGGDEWDWKFGSDKLVVPVGCLPEKNGYRECWVVPGSIRHDNCCVRFPFGQMCAGTRHSTDGKPAEENNHDSHCVQEWDDAKWDVIWHRAWKHSFPVNRGPPDLTPAISSRYPDGETVTTVGLCAPKEHEMRQEADVSFCCSRRFRKGWFGENTKICA